MLQLPSMLLGVIGPWQIIICLIPIALIGIILFYANKKQDNKSMNYCPKCGNAVPEGTAFCPKCGANVQDVALSQPQNTQQPIPPCPPTYLALSIIVTVLCCLPFGIVGIIKSSSVSKEYALGNYAAAQGASKQAKTWSIAGLCCGLLWITIYLVFFVIMAANA